MFSTPLHHFNVVNVVTWSKQSRVNCKPQETTLSGGRGGRYYLPACKPRNSRKMYDICLSQLLLSMIESWTKLLRHFTKFPLIQGTITNVFNPPPPFQCCQCCYVVKTKSGELQTPGNNIERGERG